MRQVTEATWGGRPEIICSCLSQPAAVSVPSIAPEALRPPTVTVCLLSIVLFCIMGWFSWSSETAQDKPEPPLRQNRKQCWESRDAYFACLDAKGVVKPGDEGTACADVKKPYEKNCAKSWVRSHCLLAVWH